MSISLGLTPSQIVGLLVGIAALALAGYAWCRDPWRIGILLTDRWNELKTDQRSQAVRPPRAGPSPAEQRAIVEGLLRLAEINDTIRWTAIRARRRAEQTDCTLEAHLRRYGTSGE